MESKDLSEGIEEGNVNRDSVPPEVATASENNDGAQAKPADDVSALSGLQRTIAETGKRKLEYIKYNLAQYFLDKMDDPLPKTTFSESCSSYIDLPSTSFQTETGFEPVPISFKLLGPLEKLSAQNAPSTSEQKNQEEIGQESAFEVGSAAGEAIATGEDIATGEAIATASGEGIVTGEPEFVIDIENENATPTTGHWWNCLCCPISFCIPAILSAYCTALFSMRRSE